ncbi:Biopolymer transporter ExbD [Planctomycetales bacterium 10988]|nr:Biopolymer transporter ExbD [Planctomycetales bacterium 10988]
MRVPTSRQYRGGGELNMTPMIDVVLQLIVFFLVSGHLAQQEAQVTLDLPLAESSQQSVESKLRRVTVNILLDGSLVFSGKTMNQEELQRRLLSEHEEHGKELEVRIRSDRKVEYRKVEPVLLGCAKAGIWNVTLAVQPGAK